MFKPKPDSLIRESYREKLMGLQSRVDPKSANKAADKVICALLCKLGYPTVAETFEEVKAFINS